MRVSDLPRARVAADVLLEIEDALGVSVEFFLERVHSVDCFLLDGNAPTREESVQAGFSVTVRHREATGEVAVNSLSPDALSQGLAAAADRAGAPALPLDRLAAAVAAALGPSAAALGRSEAALGRSEAALGRSGAGVGREDGALLGQDFAGRGLAGRDPSAGLGLAGRETHTLWTVYDAARREGPLSSVAVSHSGELREFLVLAPGRTHREIAEPRYLLSCRAISEQDTVGYRKIGVRDLDVWASGQAAAEIGGDAGRSALRKRGAAPVRQEDAVVVVAAGASGVLAHELVGHPLEGDIAVGGLAGVRWAPGDRIGPAHLTVVDDPGLPGAWGSFPYDDTGAAADRCPLVEGGVVTGFVEGTGRQRRQSFRCPPLSRMSNVVMAPGPDDPAALTGSVRDGYHVALLGGGMVAESGVFTVGGVNIHRIRRGRLAEPVADSVITGRVSTALRHIRAIGSDFALGGPAACGKYGQGVPVGDGGPTLLMTGLNIEPAHSS
ncbi:TldD/PmbA family protein [Streptomyces sp. NPDC058657]|uniref:TldD/PmbA family protein n=1 Tax=unclassified Streptomyces TaxID=2593676 RepID=UPI00366220AE